MRRPCLEVVVLLALAGCTPDVGECDTAEAHRLVYNQEGVPSFAGQALMVQSCGNGAYCHSPDAEGWERAGAPLELDFDVRLASSSPRTGRSGRAEATELRRLESNRALTQALAGEIWAQVSGGTMPPWAWDTEPHAGEMETAAAARRSAWADATQPTYEMVTNEAGTEFEPLPGLDTEEGREILRNWLACRAPAVERVDPRPPLEELAPFDPDYHSSPVCERNCVGITWPEIVDGILLPRCATSGCHLQPAGDGAPAGSLDLGLDPMAADPYADLHARLLGAPPQGSSCDEGSPGGAAGLPILAAGEPDRSLLLQKVERPSEDICGARMPASGGYLSDQRLCVLREWIFCGACVDHEADPDCAMCLEMRLAGCNLTAVGDATCRDVTPCVGRLEPD